MVTEGGPVYQTSGVVQQHQITELPIKNTQKDSMQKFQKQQMSLGIITSQDKPRNRSKEPVNSARIDAYKPQVIKKVDPSQYESTKVKKTHPGHKIKSKTTVHSRGNSQTREQMMLIEQHMKQQKSKLMVPSQIIFHPPQASSPDKDLISDNGIEEILNGQRRIQTKSNLQPQTFQPQQVQAQRQDNTEQVPRKRSGNKSRDRAKFIDQHDETVEQRNFIQTEGLLQGRQQDQHERIVIVNGGKSSGQISRNDPSSPPTLTEEGVGGKIQPRRKVSKRGNLMEDAMENQTTIKLNELSYEDSGVISNQQTSPQLQQENEQVYQSGEAREGYHLGQEFEEFIQLYDKKQQNATATDQVVSNQQQKQNIGEIKQLLNQKMNQKPKAIQKVSMQSKHSEELGQSQNPPSQFNQSTSQVQEFESSEEELDTLEQMRLRDPLFSDKQYLVTHIYNSFAQLEQQVMTTPEFYRVGKLLGRGAFGKVNLAQHKLTGHFVAVKSLKKTDLEGKEKESFRDKVTNEISILQKVNHKNIVRLYDSYETDNRIVFVMDLCGGGDLLSYIRRRKRLSEDCARHIFKQAVKGLQGCHKHLVMHRDIKLENMLLDEEGTLKICDFGVSKICETSVETNLITDQCGTPAYMAPEVFRKEHYRGDRADIWSLGICLYIMVFGTVPFASKNIKELGELIKEGKLEFPDTLGKSDKNQLYNHQQEVNPVGKEVKELIKHLLQVNPAKRPTLKQILKMPWIKRAPKRFKIYSQAEITHMKYLVQVPSGSDEIQKLLTEYSFESRTTPPEEQSAVVPKQQAEKGLKRSDSELTDKTVWLSFSKPGQQTVKYLKNVSSTSIIYAPFNTSFDGKSNDQNYTPDNCPHQQNSVVFVGKARESNRQYEFNFNGEVDNGVLLSSQPDKGCQLKEMPSENFMAEPNSAKKMLKLNGLNGQQSSLDGDSISHRSRQKQLTNQTGPRVESRLGANAPHQSQASSRRHKDDEPHNNVLIRLEELSSLNTKPQETENVVNKDSKQKEPLIRLNFNGVAQNGQLVQNDKKSMRSVEQISALDYERRCEDKHRPQPHEMLLLANETSDEGSVSNQSDKEIEIDKLIVCKIENEFGYPEQYLDKCLRKGIKNDATTCYHLLVQEDKHEVIDLLQDD